MKTQGTNLHAEKDLILSLELSEHSDEVGLEQAGNVGRDEAVQPDRVGPEPLQLFSDDEAFFAHLFLPPPYRKARPRRRTRSEPGRVKAGSGVSGGQGRNSSQCKTQH